MEPCPSPNGTNIERLFIVRKTDRRMAMDAAIGTPDDGDIVGKVRELLAGKLEPGDLDALLALLQPEPAPDDQFDAQDRRRRGMATRRCATSPRLD